MHVGNKHDYLGVDLEFKQDRWLEVSMVNYLRNVFRSIPGTNSGESGNPSWGEIV